MRSATLRRRRQQRILQRMVRFCLIPVALLLTFFLGRWAWRHLLPHRSYSAADFGIQTIHSSCDYNNNGQDDYTDFLMGAKADAKKHPRYDGVYQAGGYPPDDVGVCADVIWRAFKNAGYCLRDMVDADIAARPSAYPNMDTRDPNIDFRRVKNLKVFFETYAISLTTDPTQIDQWQPGDIVIFRDDKHIGMVSDKRNADGWAFMLHNSGQPNREEDYLPQDPPTSHFRFDASLVPPELLLPWTKSE